MNYLPYYLKLQIMYASACKKKLSNLYVTLSRDLRKHN